MKLIFGSLVDPRLSGTILLNSLKEMSDFALSFEVWMLYSDFWTFDGLSAALNIYRIPLNIYRIPLGCVFDDVYQEDLKMSMRSMEREPMAGIIM